MILHIPHSSRVIPSQSRDQIILTSDELDRELIRMTDAYTDELFDAPGAARIVFPFSRLVVDVERFRHDADEPMAAAGLGAVYTKTSLGQRLRRDLALVERKQLLVELYDHHHRLLGQAAEAALNARSVALIIDCHSFPSRPLPCDHDQSEPRPDFCIGTDSYHTLAELPNEITKMLEAAGYRVSVNRPYSGTMVPADRYRKDRRVLSVMIEVNRKLFLDEQTASKSQRFSDTCSLLQSLLACLLDMKNRWA